MADCGEWLWPMIPFGLVLRRVMPFVGVHLGLLWCQTLHAAVGLTITPSSVSNTYSGNITFQITGLSSGQAVLVQKFLDVNTNGVIDGADPLWRQFQLTDDQASVIGGVTNINVPGDTSTISGQITAREVFQNPDPGLNVVGKYFCKLSSPTGLFAPLTNTFTITNATYAQTLTGNVRNNGTNVPHAVILVFHAPEFGEDGPGWSAGGTVANSAGAYTIKLPPGSYVPAALKSDYIANLAASPVTLGSGATVAANINLLNATHTISGKVTDAANNAVGLPGLLVHATSAGLAAASQSDANGNFSIRVGSGHWNLGASGVEAFGYLSKDSDNVTVDTTAGSVSGLNLDHPKATALVYGYVKDDHNQPVAGVFIFSGDSEDLNEHGSFTDSNGYYVAGALGVASWNVDIDTDQPIVASHVYSGGFYMDLAPSQAARHDFTAILATHRITGHAEANDGNVLPGVRVYTYALIDDIYYGTDTKTDAAGNYVLHVPDGSWTVGICCGCDSWISGYCCPNNRFIDIAGADDVVYLIASGKAEITTPSPLLDAYVGEYYAVQFEAVSCELFGTWTASDLPLSFELTPYGYLYGVPDIPGPISFSVTFIDNAGTFSTKPFSLVVRPALTGGVSNYYVNKLKSYRQTSASSVNLESNPLPFHAFLGILQESLALVSQATCTLPNSTVKAFPSGDSTMELQVHETFASAPAFDAAYPAGNYSFALSTVNYGEQTPVIQLPLSAYPDAPRVLNYDAAQRIDPHSDFILEWDAPTVLTDEDYILLTVSESLQPPAFSILGPTEGYVFYLGGAETSIYISAGTFPAGGRAYWGTLLFAHISSVNEGEYPIPYGSSLVCAQTVFPLATTSAGPIIEQPVMLTSTQFGFMLTGDEGQNYTIQRCTNLTTMQWTDLFVTNAPAPTFMVIDPNATNRSAFYRVLVGP